MVFTDERGAKSFFVERIIAQAKKEGVNLSESERYMLAWSENDPTFAQIPALTRQFEKDTTAATFEEKVIGLLKRAFEEDLQRDSQSKETYRDAYSVLSQGDHYLLIMIKAAFGFKLKRWWFF
jgi:hypothetical protein